VVRLVLDHRGYMSDLLWLVVRMPDIGVLYLLEIPASGCRHAAMEAAVWSLLGVAGGLGVYPLPRMIWDL